MAATNNAPTGASGASAGKRILVVEDEAIIRETVRQLLTSEGYDVVTAEDGSEALTQAKQTSPDAIILDIGLPSAEPGAGQFDGFGVMQWLALRLPKVIPVIVLTARQDEATRRRAESLGASRFLAKPFAPKDLISAVREVTSTGPAQA